MAKVMNFLQNNLGLPGPPPNYPAKRSEAQPAAGRRKEGQATPSTTTSSSSKPLPTGQSVEEMLTCKICQRVYSPDADGRRLPRDLGCGHVYCQKCLSDCVQASGSKTVVVCPLCKKKTQLVGNSVLELPVNRQLLSLVRSQPRQHRHHHSHSHGERSSSSGRQVRVEEGRVRDPDGSREDRKSGERKSCSCQHHDKITPEKQVVVKSAMKKLRVTDDRGQVEDLTAIVKEPLRLHPPPKGSAYAPRGEEGGGSSIGSCTDLQEVAEEVRPLSPCLEEEIQVISHEADVVRSKYPLEELHEMAPRGVLEDLNAAHGHVHDVINDRVDSSDVTSLTDLLHFQPTSAAYVSSFGRYSEVRAYPGDFCGPTKISCSRENKVLVVDRDLDGVQAFSTSGDSLANFSVAEVTGGCFLDEQTLAISSPRGIELYRLSGRLLLTIPLGLTVAVARHPDGGFVAAQPTRISIGHNPTTTVRLHTITSARQGRGESRVKRSFIELTDVAVSRSGLIAVIDDQSVLVMDQDGLLKAVIDPAALLGRPPTSSQLPDDVVNLFKPNSVTMDPQSGHVIVSDSENRYVTAFDSSGGEFVSCLVNLRDQVQDTEICPHGIAMNRVGQIFIILRAAGLAEVAIYNI